MQFANYFSSSIITFLGLAAGIFLVRIAQEEQKMLRKYLAAAKRILLAAIFAFSIFYFFNDNFFLVTLIAYLAFTILIEYRVEDLMKRSIITYIILGIIFFLSSKNASLFTINSSLIFLFGIITSSILYRKKEKNHYRIILYNMGFLLIANLLFFI